MSTLSPEQKQRAISVMHDYMSAPPNTDGKTSEEVQVDRDKKRLITIKEKLEKLITDYLKGAVNLNDFKSQIDSINKRNEYWGFKGIKGQMFFNMVVNVASDLNEIDQELKSAIKVPENEDIAASRIRTFSSYVKRLGEEHVSAGGTVYGRPKPGSIPFFLSYFWQIQNPEVWPVYYTNSVNVMVDLNLWKTSDDLAADYLSFKHLHEELSNLFGKESGKTFNLYDVEHVFWFKGGNPFGGHKPIKKTDNDFSASSDEALNNISIELDLLPESYVPPIISIIPRLALNDSSLEKAAKNSGTSVPRALEKNVDAAFTLLGYETKLLGQGQGRVPDGLAFDHDNLYAIIWDSKARNDNYSMGTDDRTIREYIVSQSRELRKKRNFRNIYYIIISSDFADDYDDAIRGLKMETDISEVILLKSDALVAMVDSKLRNPQQLSLGPDGIQRLFTTSSVLDAETVNEMLG